MPVGRRSHGLRGGDFLVHFISRLGEYGLGDVLAQGPVALELRFGVELVAGGFVGKSGVLGGVLENIGRLGAPLATAV